MEGCSDVFEFGSFTCLSLLWRNRCYQTPLLSFALLTQPPFSPSAAACCPKITYCHKTAQLCPKTGLTAEQRATAATTGHWTPLNRQQSLVPPLHLTLTCFNHPLNHFSSLTLTSVPLKSCFLTPLSDATRNHENYCCFLLLLDTTAAAPERLWCGGEPLSNLWWFECACATLRTCFPSMLHAGEKPNKCKQCKSTL